MTPQQIEAIGQLWRLAAIVLAGVALLLFRVQIRSLLDRVRSLRARRGEMEVALDTIPQLPQDAKDVGGQAVDASAPVRPEEQPEAVQAPGALEPSDWFRRMLDAFAERDFAEAETAFNSLQAAQDDDVERSRN